MLVDKIFSEVSLVSTDLISPPQLEELKAQSPSGIAIWGRGRAGEYAVSFCRKHEIHITCVVDSFAHPENSCFLEIPLLSAADFAQKFQDILVLVACSYTYGVEDFLKKRGYRYLVFDTQLLNQFLCNTPYEELLKREAYEIEDTYSLLADDISKYTLEQIVKYRLSVDRQYIEALPIQPIYFENDLIPFFQGNAFVDCGAYIGDTLLSFYQSKSCCCKTYYALEPSHNEFERLRRIIRDNKIENAVPMEVGVWDKKDTVRFTEANGPANCVSKAGEIEVQLDSIDHMFCDRQIDFIKMDIEGAEQAAILGAQNVIRDRSPIIAFSVYHKPSDLWKLPMIVKHLNNHYQLYIRHHSAYGDDTVCYAIPEK